MKTASISFLFIAALLSHALSDNLDHAPVGFASIEAHDRKGTTGGLGGEIINIRSLAALIEHASAPEPAILQIQGEIEGPPGTLIHIASHKTLIGIDAHAEIVGPELNLNKVENIIIRNLTIRDSYNEADPAGKQFDYDGIQVDASHHLWIDHCHLKRMGDGLIDLRKGSDCITVSWCVLSDHNKALGVGWTDNTTFRVTLHHNWIHHTTQRNPGFDNGMGHLYNNYFETIRACGVHARGKARLVVENSVFRDIRNPLRRDPEAALVSRGNLIIECTGDHHQGGQAFDPKQFYTYELDDTEKVVERVKRFAGPQNVTLP